MKDALRSFVSRRPRGLDLLHRLHLLGPSSQTNARELGALREYATGRHKALEIGTYQGVSAAVVAEALSQEGTLYCVDPWPEEQGRSNPCWRIARRHLRRANVAQRVRILRGLTEQVYREIPDDLDFVFIDGDHSWEGIGTDWEIVAPRVVPRGIVCLHDVIVPADEPWRTPASVRFFNEVIARDPRFELLASVHSMAVVRKL
jgi:predicted O-methyltransferase YrrM